MTTPIDHLVVDGTTIVADTTYSFTNLQADHSIEVFFGGTGSAWVIISTINDSSMGSITPLGETQVIDGSSQDFTITPVITDDVTYMIDSIEVDGTQVDITSIYHFETVQADHTIDVYYAAYGYTIHTSINDAVLGMLSPSGNITVLDGLDQTFTITSFEDCTVIDVTVDGTSIGSVVSFDFTNVSASHTLSAAFRSVVYIVSLVDSSGSAMQDQNKLDINLLLHLNGVAPVDNTSKSAWTDITSYDLTYENLGVGQFDGTEINLSIFNVDFSNLQIEFITE